MLFPLEEIIGEPDDLVCIHKSDLVMEALDIMIQNDFTQLPVVDDDGNLMGLITENSIIETYRMIGESESILELPVEHCQTKALTIEPEQDIFDALELLKTVYAIVVVDGPKPIGILTDYDTTNFFRNYSEGLILVQDVEVTLRQYIESIFPEKEQMDAALYRAFDADRRDPSRPGREYEELSFWNHVQLITQEDNWPKFEPYLGPLTVFRNFMEPVREVRNQLAHFRGQMDHTQKKSLDHALHWLASRPKVETEKETVSISPKEYPFTPKDTKRKRGKYSLIGEWLKERGDFQGNIELSFDDIEEIIGDELPPSAREHRAWWGNHYHNAQAKSWLDAGWLVDNVDLAQEKVTFRQSRKALYPGLFSDLLEGLKEARPGLTRASKVSLENWISFGAGVAGFNFSWVLPREPVLRVELYIDVEDRSKNKRAFDTLIKMKPSIEEDIGSELDWDRLDHARACRISLARPYEIADPDADRDMIIEWGISTMLDFVDTFSSRIKKLNLD